MPGFFRSEVEPARELPGYAGEAATMGFAYLHCSWHGPSGPEQPWCEHDLSSQQQCAVQEAHHGNRSHLFSFDTPTVPNLSWINFGRGTAQTKGFCGDGRVSLGDQSWWWGAAVRLEGLPESQRDGIFPMLGCNQRAFPEGWGGRISSTLSSVQACSLWGDNAFPRKSAWQVGDALSIWTCAGGHNLGSVHHDGWPWLSWLVPSPFAWSGCPDPCRAFGDRTIFLRSALPWPSWLQGVSAGIPCVFGGQRGDQLSAWHSSHREECLWADAKQPQNDQVWQVECRHVVRTAAWLVAGGLYRQRRDVGPPGRTMVSRLKSWRGWEGRRGYSPIYGMYNPT